MSTSATAITLTLGAVLGAGWVKTFSDGAASMNVLSAAGENNKTMDSSSVVLKLRAALAGGWTEAFSKAGKDVSGISSFEQKPEAPQCYSGAKIHKRDSAADRKNRQHEKPHEEAERAARGAEKLYALGKTHEAIISSTEFKVNVKCRSGVFS